MAREPIHDASAGQLGHSLLVGKIGKAYAENVFQCDLICGAMRFRASRLGRDRCA